MDRILFLPRTEFRHHTCTRSPLPSKKVYNFSVLEHRVLVWRKGEVIYLNEALNAAREQDDAAQHELNLLSARSRRAGCDTWL